MEYQVPSDVYAYPLDKHETMVGQRRNSITAPRTTSTTSVLSCFLTLSTILAEKADDIKIDTPHSKKTATSAYKSWSKGQQWCVVR